MSDDEGTPINVLRIYTDPNRSQKIAIKCRCGNRWIEPIPAELHESSMIVRFTCVKCNTQYDLQNKVLTRVKEDSSDERKQFAKINANAKQHFDS